MKDPSFKLKDCFIKLGFKFGKNVSFVNYPEPVIPQKSHKAAVIAGVFGGIFGFVILGGLTLYCIKRKKNQESPLYNEIN